MMGTGPATKAAHRARTHDSEFPAAKPCGGNAPGLGCRLLMDRSKPLWGILPQAHGQLTTFHGAFARSGVGH